MVFNAHSTTMPLQAILSCVPHLSLILPPTLSQQVGDVVMSMPKCCSRTFVKRHHILTKRPLETKYPQFVRYKTSLRLAGLKVFPSTFSKLIRDRQGRRRTITSLFAYLPSYNHVDLKAELANGLERLRSIH